MQRHAYVLRLQPGAREEYTRLHADVWPGVLEALARAHIRNYSIFLRVLDDGREHLFAYLEYHGDDFAADSARLGADPLTRRWWDVCEPLQDPLATRAPGEWWSALSEVFHHD